jgi:hypothetical protein
VYVSGRLKVNCFIEGISTCGTQGGGALFFFFFLGGGWVNMSLPQRIQIRIWIVSHI